MNHTYVENRELIKKKQETLKNCNHVLIMTIDAFDAKSGDFLGISICPICNHAIQEPSKTINIASFSDEDKKKVLDILRNIRTTIDISHEDYVTLCEGFISRYKKHECKRNQVEKRHQVRSPFTQYYRGLRHG